MVDITAIIDRLIESLGTMTSMSTNYSNLKTSTIPSSWIEAYEYRKDSKILVMHIKNGVSIEYDNISEDLAETIIKGRATCRTDDKYYRWFAGKYPSLGAAYHRYLKFRSGRISSYIEPTLGSVSQDPLVNQIDFLTRNESKSNNIISYGFMIGGEDYEVVIPKSVKKDKKSEINWLVKYLRRFKR